MQVENRFCIYVTRKLYLDMQVCWNSTYKMFDNVLYRMNILVHLVSTYSPLKSYVLLKEEWEKVTVTYKILKLFCDVKYMRS